MKCVKTTPLKIGIIGAGFSGTALAAAIHKLNAGPVEIFLFDKTGCFGEGDAYRTPYPFHLLNVRAQDMSAFEDEPAHFLDWLNSNETRKQHLEKNQPAGGQFAPRLLYGQYLNSLLDSILADK